MHDVNVAKAHRSLLRHASKNPFVWMTGAGINDRAKAAIAVSLPMSAQASASIRQDYAVQMPAGTFDRGRS
ncbi:hypothetical protein [Rhizobium yanglingense]